MYVLVVTFFKSLHSFTNTVTICGKNDFWKQNIKPLHKSYYEKFADGTVKCIDEEIPFEIPESWEWCRLSSLATFSGGRTPSTENAQYWNGDMLWVTSKDMKSYDICNTQIKLSEEGAAQMQVFPPLTILIVVRSGILRRTLPIAILRKEATINQDLKAISLFSSDLSEFIYFSLMAFEEKILAEYSKAGTTVESINFDELKTILLPLPPINEQQLIIKKVKQCGSFVEIIELNQTDIQQFITQTKSKILDLAIRGKLVPQDPNDEPASVLLERIKVERPESKKKVKNTGDNSHYTFEIPKSWEWCKFGDYIDVRDGTHDSPKYVENGFPFVTSKNLINGEIDFSNTKCISENDHISFNQRSFVENDDILFAMIGSIGNPVLVKKDREFSIKNVALFKPYLREISNMEYVYYFLFYMQSFLKTRVKGGMQPFIPLNLFRQELFISVPPLLEQKRIVKKIEEIFSSLDEISNSIIA